jgi:hypothetical protein
MAAPLTWKTVKAAGFTYYEYAVDADDEAYGSIRKTHKNSLYFCLFSNGFIVLLAVRGRFTTARAWVEAMYTRHGSNKKGLKANAQASFHWAPVPQELVDGFSYYEIYVSTNGLVLGTIYKINKTDDHYFCHIEKANVIKMTTRHSFLDARAWVEQEHNL